jgi:hypothetical protein
MARGKNYYRTPVLKDHTLAYIILFDIIYVDIIYVDITVTGDLLIFRVIINLAMSVSATLALSIINISYGLHHALVDRYGISVSHMTTDMFHLS